MHRLPSKKAIYRFRTAALLLWLRQLLLLSGIISIVYAGYTRDAEVLRIAITIIIACVITTVMQWLIGLQTKCPLCITPVLVGKNCSKNKRAKTFLGSYRLRVALHVLTRNHFRCPYCSEPTVLEVRSRKPRSRTAND